MAEGLFELVRRSQQLEDCSWQSALKNLQRGRMLYRFEEFATFVGHRWPFNPWPANSVTPPWSSFAFLHADQPCVSFWRCRS